MNENKSKEISRIMKLVIRCVTVLVLMSMCAASTYASVLTYNMLNSNNQLYTVNKTYVSCMDKTKTYCLPGIPWCLWTTHDPYKLAHYHLTQDFTDLEQYDADRWADTQAPGTPLGSAQSTTTYNNFSWAISGTIYGTQGYVWNLQPLVTLQRDFQVRAETIQDPVSVGDICQHGALMDFSVISGMNPGGYRIQDIDSVTMKYRAYGYYFLTDPGDLDGGVVYVYHPKLP